MCFMGMASYTATSRCGNPKNPSLKILNPKAVAAQFLCHLPFLGCTAPPVFLGQFDNMILTADGHLKLLDFGNWASRLRPAGYVGGSIGLWVRGSYLQVKDKQRLQSLKPCVQLKIQFHVEPAKKTL